MRPSRSIHGEVAAPMSLGDRELTIVGEYTQHYGEASVGIRDGEIEVSLLDATDEAGNVRLTPAERRNAERILRERLADLLGRYGGDDSADCAREDAWETDREARRSGY